MVPRQAHLPQPAVHGKNIGTILNSRQRGLAARPTLDQTKAVTARSAGTAGRGLARVGVEKAASRHLRMLRGPDGKKARRAAESSRSRGPESRVDFTLKAVCTQEWACLCVCIFTGEKKNGRVNRFCRIHVGIGSRLRYRHEKVVYEPGRAWGSISLAARAEGSRRGGRAACLGRPRRRSGACAHFPPLAFQCGCFVCLQWECMIKLSLALKKDSFCTNAVPRPRRWPSGP